MDSLTIEDGYCVIIGHIRESKNVIYFEFNMNKRQLFFPVPSQKRFYQRFDGSPKRPQVTFFLMQPATLVMIYEGKELRKPMVLTERRKTKSKLQ